MIKAQSLPNKITKNLDEGVLCIAEGESSFVPFPIKRIYYISGVKEGVVRGHHAHKTLEQILICVHGSIEISLDDGKQKEAIVLNAPGDFVFVGPSVWHTMKWLEDDSILLVLASQKYDENDYIRDYDEFINWMTGRKNDSV